MLVVSASDELEQGRRAYEGRAWLEAVESLSRADAVAPLAPEDLELLATTTWMLGRDDEGIGILERAHHQYLERGETLRAVRAATWIGMNLAYRGAVGPASGHRDPCVASRIGETVRAPRGSQSRRRLRPHPALNEDPDPLNGALKDSLSA